MVDVVTQIILLSVNQIRKSMGQYDGLGEFLADTYGVVVISPEIRRKSFFSMNPEYGFRLDYTAIRNDKVPIVTEGLRKFDEWMDTLHASYFKSIDMTMEEHMTSIAKHRERYIRKFYGRGVVVTPITKNF